jgi:hypothetical protein
MPYLEDVPHPVVVVGPVRGVPDPIVVVPRQLGGRSGVVGQEAEESVHPIRVEVELRGKLPQHRPELVVEVEDAGGQEVGERRLDS